MLQKRTLFVIYDVRRANALSFLLYPFLRAAQDNVCLRSSLTVPKDAKRNDFLLLVGWLRYRNKNAVKKFIDSAKSRGFLVGYFDDGDSAEVSKPEWVQYFDLWYKKQLFRDFYLYQVPREGRRLWSGSSQGEECAGSVVNEKAVLSGHDTSKLRLAWNILVGSYPIQPNAQRITSFFGRALGHSAAYHSHRLFNEEQAFDESVLSFRRDFFCQARFSVNAYGSVGYQRRRFIEEIRGSEIFRHGKLSANDFRNELFTAAACLSPFGWGEVCYRDAEAIRQGACLVKPDMSHIMTWPDVYARDLTYCAVRWDGADLVERVNLLLSEKKWQADMRCTAFKGLAYAQEKCGRRVEKVMRDFEALAF